MRKMRRCTKRADGGFSLAEVLISLSLLSFALVSLGSFTVKFISLSAHTYARAQARSYAVEQLEQLRRQPYSEIETIPAGPIDGADGFTRAVTVTRVGGPTAVEDYKIVTVEVRPPGGLTPVRITSAITAT